MPVVRRFEGLPAIILGTGPSLSKQADSIRGSNAKIFGINNTYRDFDLDVWIACDPQWHHFYGKVEGEFDKWHWDREICSRYGYQYVEGKWGEGLSLNNDYIHYGHSSGYQALNLAVLYGCDPIYLAGYDMKYEKTRHYFTGLSKKDGEYPESLRKWSTFDGLIKCYNTIASQPGLPAIYNITKDSGLTCFEHKSFA